MDWEWGCGLQGGAERAQWAPLHSEPSSPFRRRGHGRHFFNDKDINIYIYDAKRTRSSVGLLKAELCCASPSAEYFALCFFLKERGF